MSGAVVSTLSSLDSVSACSGDAEMRGTLNARKAPLVDARDDGSPIPIRPKDKEDVEMADNVTIEQRTNCATIVAHYRVRHPSRRHFTRQPMRIDQNLNN